MKWTDGNIARLPNCGVFACAMAADMTTAQAMNWFQEHHHGNWRGRTTDDERMRFLKEHDIAHRDVFVPSQYGRMTLQRCIDSYVIPGVSYIIQVTGHIVFFEDGLVIDQYECCAPDAHWARRKIVRTRTELLKRN